ncbi:MAG TPA: AraC family transcriptional regulator, partial [Bacilli bacterium]
TSSQLPAVLTNKLNEWILRVHTEKGIHLMIGISGWASSLLTEVHLSFNQAKAAVNYHFFQGNGKVNVYTPLMSIDSNKLPLYKWEDELGDAVRRLDKDKLSKILNDIFDSATAGGFIQPQRFIEDLTELAIHQLKHLKPFILEDILENLKMEIKTKLGRCEDHRELRQNAKKILFQIMDDIRHNEKDKNGIVMQKCKKYIEEHYMEDIPLELLARKFHFNPSYFSSLFKMSEGVGYSQYLLTVRMQKAQYLIMNTTGNMANIAFQVGYKDAAYFNKLFKKEFGISPYKFRQISGKV